MRKTAEALVSAAIGMALVGVAVLLIAHRHPSALAVPNPAVTSHPVAATPPRGSAPVTTDPGDANGGGVGGLGPAGTPNGLSGTEPHAPAAAAGSTTALPTGPASGPGASPSPSGTSTASASPSPNASSSAPGLVGSVVGGVAGLVGALVGGLVGGGS